MPCSGKKQWMTESKKIRVLVVDDSALIRQLLTSLLNEAPDITVVAQAPDPIVAREMIKQHNPDVITLDIEMPQMDGLTFLARIMAVKPLPVIMVSTLTAKGADATMQALQLGAVDYVTKPQTDLKNALDELKEEIHTKIRVASKARVRAPVAQYREVKAEQKVPASPAMQASERIIAIGSSTGGVEAVTEILTHLPAEFPAIMITQHMPEKFTTSFAQRLNSLCQLNVQEAQPNMPVKAGNVYIAPGNYHMELSRSGAQYVCKIGQADPVSGHRPSVDVLFRSVALLAGRKATGVILTGMGRDGADGLLTLRKAGAYTIGQDEGSCVVYGMPKAAFELGAVEKQLGITQVAGFLQEIIKGRQSA